MYMGGVQCGTNDLHVDTIRKCICILIPMCINI